MANLHATGRYTADMFHPHRESPPVILDLDNPGAEYERLIKEQAGK